MVKLFLFVICSAALLYGAVTLSREEHPSSSTAPSAVLSVTVVRPQQGSMAETISATGVTISREEIQIMTELSGVRVSDVFVDVGDSVKKGQKIAMLDGEALANQLEQLKSDYERARDAFSRVDGIKETGAVSKQLVMEKRMDMQATKAKLDDAQLNLKRCTILAPESGMVFERQAVIGGLVNSSEPLFRIARRFEIEMEAMVPESDLTSLNVGQPVSVMLTGESKSIQGSIRRITPRIEDTTRMAAIRIRLHSTNPIPVGLFATARIMQPDRKGMLLPKTALQHDGSGDYVWLLSTENKTVRLPTKVALLDDEQMLVNDLSPDVRVVARAGAFLKEGDLVRVSESR